MTMEKGEEVAKLNRDLAALRESKIKTDEMLSTLYLKAFYIEKEVRDFRVERDRSMAEKAIRKKKLLEKEKDGAAHEWMKGTWSFVGRHKVHIMACVGIVGLALLARAKSLTVQSIVSRRLEEK